MTQQTPVIFDGASLFTTIVRPDNEAEDRTACVVPQSASGASVFDNSFDLLKSNLLPIVLLVSLVFLPLHLIEQYIVSAWLNPSFISLNLQQHADNSNQIYNQIFVLCMEYIPTGYPAYGIPGIMLIVASFFTLAPVSAVVSNVIAGAPPSVVGGFRTTWFNLPKIVCSSLLMFLCCFAIWACTTLILGFVGFFPLAYININLSNTQIAGWASFIYFLVCTAVPLMATSLFFGRTFAFVIPVCINEGASFTTSIARSQQLAAVVPYRTTLFTFIMLPLLVIAVQFMLIFGCTAALQIFHLSSAWSYMAEAAICALIVCLVHAYWMVYVSCLYYDFRVKRECLDIRVLLAMESGK